MKNTVFFIDRIFKRRRPDRFDTPPLIHGDIDDNVPVTESFRLANALVQAKRDVDLVILPNTTHNVAQPFFWRRLR